MSHMFSGCESLNELDISNFNTEKVCNMMSIFYRCESLTNINLSNFNTQNVTDMRSMFWGCSSLTNKKIITNDQRIINQFFKDKR